MNDDHAERAARFWDRVHATHDVRWVADHAAAEHMSFFMMLGGTFEDEFTAARSVLDIGPGYARLLRACGPETARYAIEISDVNRERLAEAGIKVIRPGDMLTLPRGQVDLAWSVSCLQHCDWPMTHLLISQLAEALRPGGIAYIEAVEQRHGREITVEPNKMAGGQYVVPQETLIIEAASVRLACTHVVENPEVTAVFPIRAYFLRLVKE